jgi:hypothetical protein
MVRIHARQVVGVEQLMRITSLQIKRPFATSSPLSANCELYFSSTNEYSGCSGDRESGECNVSLQTSGRLPCEQEVAGSNPIVPSKRPIFSLFEKLGNRLLNKLLYGESRRFARSR